MQISIVAAFTCSCLASFVCADDFLQDIARIESDLPRITLLAEKAAARYVDGADLGVRGGPGLASDLARRPGGLASYLGAPGQSADVVLVAPDVPETDRSELQSQQCLLIEVTGESAAAQAAWAWTWTAEFFAACTRQGRTPVMLKSPELDRRDARFYRFKGMKFHHALRLEPVPRGQLGCAYLAEIRRAWTRLDHSALAYTSRRIDRVLQRGGRVFVRVGPRFLAHRLDPGFTPLDHDGSNPALPAPASRDLVLAFGDTQEPGSLEWGEPELLRSAGQGVVWITTGCVINLPMYLRRGETFIDTQAPLADAAVRVPGYDVPICPISGVMLAAIHDMLRPKNTSPRGDGR